MRHTLTTILAFASLCMHAQSIDVRDFRLAASAPLVEAADFNGMPCAAIRIPTTDRSFCFEAGLTGIVDVSYTSDDIIVYVPSDAHVLSISHRSYGVLRDWVIPTTLQQGATYTMRLECHERGKVHPATTQKQTSTSFLDLSLGFANADGWTDTIVGGLSYAYIPRHLGPYVGAFCMSRDDGDPSLSVVMGANARLLGGNGPVDWQLYAGVGLDTASSPVLDLGTRVNLGGSHSWGRWDFGVGCVYWNGEIIPKVNLGLGIWCGGLLVTVGIAGLAMGL